MDILSMAADNSDIVLSFFRSYPPPAFGSSFYGFLVLSNQRGALDFSPAGSVRHRSCQAGGVVSDPQSARFSCLAQGSRSLFACQVVA